jgi:hypothetical protein
MINAFGVTLDLQRMLAIGCQCTLEAQNYARRTWAWKTLLPRHLPRLWMRRVALPVRLRQEMYAHILS